MLRAWGENFWVRNVDKMSKVTIKLTPSKDELLVWLGDMCFTFKISNISQMVVHNIGLSAKLKMVPASFVVTTIVDDEKGA